MLQCSVRIQKKIKHVLLLDLCYNAKPSTQIKHCCLSQTCQSATWWWKKICCYDYIAKREGSISPSNLDGELSEVLDTPCLCHTFPVNVLVFFCFLLHTSCWLSCCGWITNLEANISLPHLIGNCQTCYSYMP